MNRLDLEQRELLLGDGNHRHYAATVLGRDVPAAIHSRKSRP